MKVHQQSTIAKAVVDLTPGDVLVGKHGGHSVVEFCSDPHSALLGFMRIKTEHGQLYLAMNKKVRVLPDSKKE